MNNNSHPKLWLCELRYYGTLGGLAMMTPLALGAMLWLLPAERVDVENDNSILYIPNALAASSRGLAPINPVAESTGIDMRRKGHERKLVVINKQLGLNSHAICNRVSVRNFPVWSYGWSVKITTRCTWPANEKYVEF